MIQLNNWSINTVSTLHIETNRVIVGFVWEAELEKAMLVQRRKYALIPENLLTVLRHL